jgi:hypothetical protein
MSEPLSSGIFCYYHAADFILKDSEKENTTKQFSIQFIT